jgi:hypothetical protein
MSYRLYILAPIILISGCAAEVSKSKSDDINRVTNENTALKEQAVTFKQKAAFCFDQAQEQRGEACQAEKNEVACVKRLYRACLKEPNQ